MSLFNENVLPSKTGKRFGTNAKKTEDLQKIAKKILEIHGVLDVRINTTVFPVELTIHSKDFSIISISDIQQKAIDCGFHLVPKFEL
ncbi:MAG: heavy-metal-associated domain-containing protein [Balneola sp.]